MCLNFIQGMFTTWSLTVPLIKKCGVLFVNSSFQSFVENEPKANTDSGHYRNRGLLYTDESSFNYTLVLKSNLKIKSGSGDWKGRTPDNHTCSSCR